MRLSQFQISSAFAFEVIFCYSCFFMQEILLIYQIVWISVTEVINVKELVFIWLIRNIVCWYNMHTSQNCMQMEKLTSFKQTRIFDVIFRSVLYLNHFISCTACWVLSLRSLSSLTRASLCRSSLFLLSWRNKFIMKRISRSWSDSQLFSRVETSVASFDLFWIRT